MTDYAKIGLVLTKEAAADLDTRLAQGLARQEQTTACLIRGFFTVADVQAEDKATGQRLYVWNRTWWVSYIAEASFIRDFLLDLDPEQYLFVRVGGELGDMESKGDFLENEFGFRPVQDVEYKVA